MSRINIWDIRNHVLKFNPDQTIQPFVICRTQEGKNREKERDKRMDEFRKYSHTCIREKK